MLIANLFALEAVHIAEVIMSFIIVSCYTLIMRGILMPQPHPLPLLAKALKLPLMMAHPYPAPTTLPRHFSCCFRMNDPQTYLLLHKAMKEKKEDEQHHPGKVCTI